MARNSSLKHKVFATRARARRQVYAVCAADCVRLDARASRAGDGR